MRLADSTTRQIAIWVALLVLLLVCSLYPACHAQEPKTSTAVSVQITFLPPPLDKATYSLGIFDARTNKLVRHLQELALEKDFTVGLNGLVTTWDRQDDEGKPVPPGRYAARGYAVGPLKIEGEAILDNDWASDDENLRLKRVLALALLPGDAGLAVLGRLADGTSTLVRFSTTGNLVWRKAVGGLSTDEKPSLLVDSDGVGVMPSRVLPNGKIVNSVATCRINDGAPSKVSVSSSATEMPLPPLPPGARLVTPPPAAEFSPSISDPGLSVRSGVRSASSPSEHSFQPSVADAQVQRSAGKDSTVWTAAGLLGLVQTAADGTVLRHLELTPGDPLPIAVSASATNDQLYLLEEKKGWQRVRGLSWVETKEENGRPVSIWKTFFERNIRQPEPASAGVPPVPIEINLDENPLAPGKPQKIRVVPAFDAKGSYLSAEDGLRLRRISERSNLQSVRLTKGKPPSPLDFFQYDGAATDEFSISGVHRIMAFDAGDFELTATGEKPADAKTAEPPDL